MVTSGPVRAVEHLVQTFHVRTNRADNERSLLSHDQTKILGSCRFVSQKPWSFLSFGIAVDEVASLCPIVAPL
jgi:hypothetical protein